MMAHDVLNCVLNIVQQFEGSETFCRSAEHVVINVRKGGLPRIQSTISAETVVDSR